MSKRPLKVALLRISSTIGLAVSLILTVIGVTGATMSFEDEIGASLNAGIMRVDPRAARMLTPDALIARLQADHEFGKVSAVTLSSDPGAAARIRFARSKSDTGPSSVYVDPYDGHLLGVPRGEDFFATVRKLHRYLLVPGDDKGYGAADHGRGRDRPDRDADLGVDPAVAAPCAQCEGMAETKPGHARPRLRAVAAFRHGKYG